MDGVNRMNDMMTDQLMMFKKMGNRITRLEKALNLPPNVDLKDEVASEDDEPVSPHEERRMHGPFDDASSDPTHLPIYDMADEEVEKEPGPPLPPGQPSIPTNHTTGAGHLLNWPCINDMLREALDKEDIRHLSEFPIQIEERRGTLRVYGRGEGREERDPRAVHGSAEIPDDLYPDLNSPTPGDSSGYIGGFSPGSVNDNATSSPRPAPLNQSGIPDFSEKTIMNLLRSFQDNILNMHPIILPRTLRQMVEKFLESIPKPTKAFNPASTASFVPQSPQASAFETAGTKRKRSPGAEMPDTPQFQHRIGRPTRTINNAVVLAMLALGKVCLKRDVVPDVVHDDDRVGNDSPNSPNASSPECPPSAPYPSTMMSPKTSERSGRGRRPSVQGNGIVPQTRRNYDVIPGLEYFAIATDIIGNQIGGNSLNHVYASIFAGLYHGQLGRVIESHAYIGHGCTVLWNILRP
ncbi:hypothetical protein IMZ48_12245 [Candidatus Bathyarchaeota archaeon]|nr:hypothetical protein [Candidatus Bathyarchaeota archaeon]